MPRTAYPLRVRAPRSASPARTRSGPPGSRRPGEITRDYFAFFSRGRPPVRAAAAAAEGAGGRLPSGEREELARRAAGGHWLVGGSRPLSSLSRLFSGPCPSGAPLFSGPGADDWFARPCLTRAPPPPPPPSGVVRAGACLEESAADRAAAAARSLGSAPPCRPPPSGALLPPRRIPEGSAASAPGFSARPPARSFLAGPRRAPPQWPEEPLSSLPSQPPSFFPLLPILPGLIGSLGWELRRGKRLGSPRRRLSPPPPCGGGRGSRLGGHRSGSDHGEGKMSEETATSDNE
ncbi:hypothetical protein J1605_011487 [Eschrichtius robustus]|uniref:Uncharacterized protein n=1 Tax=Eschrichtius robustus TaxID=9764 RepID=A0AB34GJD7_ESCRO|nr:hypothetical protein J1605_011487 [Eschrichtius robustus]